MNRLRPLLTTSALTALAGSVLVGHAALVVGAAVLVLAVVPLWFPRVQWRDVVDRSWSARAGAVAPPTRPGDRPSTRRVAFALGRAEARELVVHPWFAIGIGFCVLMVLTFASAYDGANGGETRGRLIQDLQFLAHPLVGMAVLAGHHAATRAHRDRSIELFDCCPTAPRTRAAGALLASWVPVAALGVFFVAYLASADLFSPVRAPLGPAAVPNTVGGVVLGAGGAALGLAIGRWVRSPLAPVVAVVLIGFASLRLANGADGAYAPRMLLSTMSPVGDPTWVFTTVQAWVHAAWLVALTMVTAAIALAPTSRTNSVRAVTA